VALFSKDFLLKYFFIISINSRSIPRDYPQTWTQQQSTNYKPTTKLPMVQTGNYPQQTSYQLPHQQIYVGAYPYPTQTVRKFLNLRLMI